MCWQCCRCHHVSLLHRVRTVDLLDLSTYIFHVSVIYLLLILIIRGKSLMQVAFPGG